MAHLRIHYGIKPFVCSYCYKSFNEKGNLKTHIRIHTGERPFKCKLCQKGFKALGQMKDHLISHTGYKPFQCPHCKKFYRRKEILKNHIVIHSKEVYFKNNKEKYNEILNEVRQMKNIKHNFKELETISKNNNDLSFSSSFFKEDARNMSISKSSNCSSCSNEGKEYNLKNQLNYKEIEKENLDKYLNDDNKNYFNKLNEDILIYWKNKINNIFSIRDEISIIEKNLTNNNIKNSDLFCLYNCNNKENNNKYENDECSNMTNLYFSEYEHKNNEYELSNQI